MIFVVIVIHLKTGETNSLYISLCSVQYNELCKVYNGRMFLGVKNQNVQGFLCNNVNAEIGQSEIGLRE